MPARDDEDMNEPSATGKRHRGRKPSGRQRILDVADSLLYTGGLNLVGVDRIIDEAGVAKATLYRNFGSKDALIDAYLKTRHEQTMGELEAIRRSGMSVPEKVNGVFDFLERLTSEDVFRGCAFVLAAVESSDHEHPAWKWAARHKAEVKGFFEEILAPLGDGDTVSDLAQKMMILYDGALVTVALKPESGAVSHARSMALLLLEATWNHLAAHQSG